MNPYNTHRPQDAQSKHDQALNQVSESWLINPVDTNMPAPVAAANVTQEVLFIDSRVPDLQKFINGKIISYCNIWRYNGPICITITEAKICPICIYRTY